MVDSKTKGNRRTEKQEALLYTKEVFFRVPQQSHWSKKKQMKEKSSL